MDVLIIEDEFLAREKLKHMLFDMIPDLKIVGEIATVYEAKTWLAEKNAPDIAFVDIQLADDHSFEIFKSITVTFPIIFTTAYDKYLLESFEFNSIDYLLKPITEEKLKRAINKIENLKSHFSSRNFESFINSRASVPERLIVKKGTEFLTIELSSIAYFFTEHRIVFARDFNGKQFITDKTLGELEPIIAGEFFRLNRKYIANKKSIERFKSDSGRIRVHLLPVINDEIYISKETAPEFRKWIGAV